MLKFYFLLSLSIVPILSADRIQEYMPADALEPIKKLQEQKIGNSSLADILLLSNSFVSETVGDIPSANITDPCLDVLTHFADQASDFTKCLLRNARPFRMCEKCVKHYTRATNLYNDLLGDETCSAILLLADRMQVMSSTYKTFVDLWQGADCIKCFTSIEENSTTGEVTYSFTADTLEFVAKHKNWSICVNDTSGWDWDMQPNNSTGNQCTVCLGIYRDLNRKFEAMRTSSSGHVCMDLVDMMNYTRLMWSTKFRCHHPTADTTVIVILSVMVGIGTIMLYIFSRILFRGAGEGIFRAKRLTAEVTTSYGSTENRESLNASLATLPSSSPVNPITSSTTSSNCVS